VLWTDHDESLRITTERDATRRIVTFGSSLHVTPEPVIALSSLIDAHSVPWFETRSDCGGLAGASALAGQQGMPVKYESRRAYAPASVALR
jgi:hypothetical protein